MRLYTAPPELDPFSEEAIRAANPALDAFMNKREVLAMANDAMRMPSRENEYRNLVLNQRVESSIPRSSPPPPGQPAETSRSTSRGSASSPAWI